MNRSTKLQPVVKISKQQEKNAARLHADMLRQAEQQRKQLDELIMYRNQYLKAFQSAAESGISAVQMQDYRLFINRLDVAIEQQQQSVAHSQNKCDISQQELIDKRSRSKMIDKIVENRQQQENHILEKREQRELEDLLHKNITKR
ncbi:MAG: flagellar export protein FliJ [Gammaproteobacteria bacterium]|jgi:flagellar FliJ protein|nr:flagellar export protein FliJ [Gammaproteobacteria bacterium]